MIKKGISVLFVLFLLSSCFFNKEDKIKIENITTDNKSYLHKELWTLTGQIILENKQEQFKKDIIMYDKQISDSGSIDFNTLIEKARRLEYIGDLGGAIRLYEENYNKKEFANSLVYNHNIAKLYETAQKNDLAIAKYRFLIEKFKNYTYLRDVAMLYQSMGNNSKYEAFMKAYTKYATNNNNSGLGIDIDTK